MKCEAIELVFKVAQYMNEETRRTRILSLFLELLHSVNIHTQRVISRILGSVLSLLAPQLDKSQ